MKKSEVRCQTMRRLEGREVRARDSELASDNYQPKAGIMLA
jgi:hypothetical protein